MVFRTAGPKAVWKPNSRAKGGWTMFDVVGFVVTLQWLGNAVRRWLKQQDAALELQVKFKWSTRRRR
jgi:hypothetical protein